ncbi:hypothetical protein QEG73_01320 [Chitinophagaceae bacterium 26-R-25]|nr:hypothetical protein [Chitinophagaceae bacterium 26-R-25]
MINHYYLAMYKATENGNNIEDATYFIQSPKVMDREQIKDLIKTREKYTTENIVHSSVIAIEEEMFKGLADKQVLTYDRTQRPLLL